MYIIGYNYLSATIQAQNIKINFKKPSDNFLRVTQVSFEGIDAYKKWKETHINFGKIKEQSSQRVIVNVYNLNMLDEFEMAINENARIIFSDSLIAYMLNKTVNIFKECFQN